MLTLSFYFDMMDMLGGLYALFFCLLLIKLANVIRNSFLNEDFRQSFVKILVNPKGFTVFCASAWQKSSVQKIFDLKAEDFILDFWLLSTREGWRLSRAKHRKAFKRNVFRLFRIISANLCNIRLYGKPKALPQNIFL